MNNVDLFKTMFTKDEFNSLLNTNDEILKNESTESWKNSKQIYLQDSGHKIHNLTNKVNDGLNFWIVSAHHDCMGWNYKFIGNDYDELIEYTEENLINYDRFEKLNKILNGK